MSNELKREDLLSLESYSEQRSTMRQEVMAIKKRRNLELGNHMRLLFENQKTVQYQIQEMLRIEKIFEAEGINEELEVYNPLVPDGANLKATMMIEYPDVEERTQALSRLIGVEKKVFFKVGSHPNVFAICNEDLDRETAEKTSSVHFMRFEFTKDMIADFISGSRVTLGVEHNAYSCEAILGDEAQKELASDFEA